MCILCEAARQLQEVTDDVTADSSAQPFQSVLVAAFDFDIEATSGQIVRGPNAPQLLLGTADEQATVTAILSRLGYSGPSALFSFATPAEPAIPAVPVAPSTDVTRIGGSLNNEFTVLTSARVRIETRGGDDSIWLGNGFPDQSIFAVVIGAAGRESVSFRRAQVVGWFDLGAGADTIFTTTTAPLAAGSAITALLGDGEDIAWLNTGLNYIDGGADRDNLSGGDQNDTLIGGDGNDRIDGERLESASAFTTRVSGGNDLLFGGAGNDELYGVGGADQMVGGSGDDTISGMWDNDVLWGGTGNDLLLGGGDDDQIYGGEGDDSLNGDEGNDLLAGGHGNDFLVGGSGNDTLIAGEGVDFVRGSEGDDIFVDSSIGFATFEGGADNDTYIITNANTVVREFAGEGADDVAYVYANDWVPAANIERIIYMNGAAPPNAAVLALHSTEFRQQVGTTSTFRYMFVEAPYNQFKDGVANFPGFSLPEGQSLQMVALDLNFRQAFRQAADEFERVANIRFVEVTNLNEADFAVGSHNMAPAGYATPGVVPGDRFIDTFMISNAIATTELLRGQGAHRLMLHELGHIIGLKHPFEGSFQLPGEDVANGRLSVMSYGEGGSDNGLMIFDVEAARFIHGTKLVATGNDVYRIDRANFWYPGLVDDGGVDTIDVSASQVGATVNLAPGEFSSINFMQRNLGITNSTVIENAIGTAYSDFISGNDADNRLEGGAGDDTIVGGPGNDIIDGGLGIDTAVLNDTGALVTVRRGVGGVVTISSAADGTDTLFDTEFVRISGIDYRLSQFTATSVPRLDNFTIGAGWTTQDRFTRHVGDINGDGYGDIVGFGQSGTLAVLGSSNGGFGPLYVAMANFGVNQGWTSDNTFRRELADVNGDGRDDIVGFGTAGVLVALAQANGTFGAATLGSTNFNPANGWTSQDGFARTLADVNGDGFSDIVGFGVAGTFVALGTGIGTFGAANFALANFGSNQGWSSDNTFHREVGDVNGDGRADVVGFGVAGTLVALGQANGTFAAPTLGLGNFGTNQGWTTQDEFTRDLGDVNGDGSDDVVGFGVAGTFVAYGQTNGSFSNASFELANFGRDQGWSSDNVFHRELADLNNDGRADIVGFGQSGVFGSTAFQGLVV